MRAGALRKKAASRPVVPGILLAIVALSLLGCQGEPSTPAIDAAELLLGAAAYPPGWELCESGKYLAGEASPNLTEGAEEVAFQAFCFTMPEARSGQRVYRFRDKRKAAGEYREFERVFFSGDWQIPDDLLRASEAANQWRVGCSDQRYQDETICFFLGQYEEYLVFFSATIVRQGQELVTTTELASLLREIDQKMAGRR